jgi:hypothetical protein
VEGLTSLFAQLSDALFGVLGPHVADDHRHALVEQHPADLQAQTTPATRDQRHLSPETR